MVQKLSRSSSAAVSDFRTISVSEVTMIRTEDQWGNSWEALLKESALLTVRNQCTLEPRDRTHCQQEDDLAASNVFARRY